MQITLSTPIEETPRVLQIRGIFDMAPTTHSTVSWDIHLPLSAKPWNIGLIVGPSGSGKSTIARRLWPETPTPKWPTEKAFIDGFPDLPIKQITEILSSVGFSSPPAWLRPFHVLSTGQQFRAQLVRLIAEAIYKNTIPLPGSQDKDSASRSPIVFDEFTSVVDRNVAQIGSTALSKTVRKLSLQFVAVTCHEDVEPWLNPDWVYRPAEGTFLWRSLRRRPPVELQIFRCHSSAWPLFAPHHYLNGNINASATCFIATWRNNPVAFSAWLPFVGSGPPTRREHRTVTLPDFQGIGIGNALSDTIAAMWTTLGYKAVSTTTHPAMIRARANSPNWKCTRAPGLAGRGDIFKHAETRLTAGFKYIGPSLKSITAKALLAS